MTWTGALEAGAEIFSAAGIRTLSRRSPGSSRAPGADAGAYDQQETRHSSRQAAAGEVEAAFVLTQVPFARVSLGRRPTPRSAETSRPELQGIAELYPMCARRILRPIPALGRTVKQGLLYVDRRPVADTEYARDPAEPGSRHLAFQRSWV